MKKRKQRIEERTDIRFLWFRKRLYPNCCFLFFFFLSFRYIFLLIIFTFTEKVLIFIVPSHPSGSVYSVSLSAQTTETQTEIEMERERGNTHKCVKREKMYNCRDCVGETKRNYLEDKVKNPIIFLSATALKLCRGERERERDVLAVVFSHFSLSSHRG